MTHRRPSTVDPVEIVKASGKKVAVRLVGNFPVTDFYPVGIEKYNAVRSDVEKPKENRSNE
jgi:hypothetical protein